MNDANTARIARLRQRALSPCISYQEFYLAFIRRYHESAGSRQARIIDAWVSAFDNTTPVIDDDELIVGKACIVLSADETQELRTLYHEHCSEVLAEMGQDSHMAIDYELLLRCGLAGIRERIREKLDSCADADKRGFYEGCLAVLESVARFSARYADCALAAAEAAEGARQQELLHIAEICRKVPEHPAETFEEAVQASHFITFCLSFDPQRPGSIQQFQLGRPDRYLYPYYRRDRERGILDDEHAQLLLDCIGIMINHRVCRGLSSGYMVGGRDRSGAPVANELTMMGMQVVDDIRLVYPAVGFCWTKDHDESYLRRACEIISHGCSHPAIFNDDVISQGLMRYGVTPEEAHDYIHSTCVEITPAAASNVWVASPYNNMLQCLLDVMDREYESFDALVEAVLARLTATLYEGLDLQRQWRAQRRKLGCKPLLSCLVNDCLDRGLDIDRGGARYTWIMPSFVGMANLTDSLYVLKKLVFEERTFTMAQFKAITDANFAGQEALRRRLEDGIDKYGNDSEDVDALFCRLISRIIHICRAYSDATGETIVPSVFCWVMHERFGRDTGASPDGRLAGFPLGDGSGPCQGRERHGPTASVISSTKWPHTDLIGGVAVNLKFSKKTFTSASGDNLCALLQVYLERGGFETQINVIDRDTLLAAQQNPEQYRDLVVRIGGYSDYFVALSPQMQAEVLLRSEHTI